MTELQKTIKRHKQKEATRKAKRERETRSAINAQKKRKKK